MGRRQKPPAKSPAPPARQRETKPTNGYVSAAEAGVVVLTRAEALAALRRLFVDGFPPPDPDLRSAKASLRRQLGIGEFDVHF